MPQSGGFDAAGKKFRVVSNSFYNASGPAFALRGAASEGAFVKTNTYGGALLNEYVGQGLVLSNNLRRVAEQGACDFDGDGRDDLFLTTGRTWWINNGGDRHWVLVASAGVWWMMLSDVSLGDVTGDGRCDVYTDVVLYTTDKNPTQSPGPMPHQPP